MGAIHRHGRYKESHVFEAYKPSCVKEKEVGVWNFKEKKEQMFGKQMFGKQMLVMIYRDNGTERNWSKKTLRSSA